MLNSITALDLVSNGRRLLSCPTLSLTDVLRFFERMPMSGPLELRFHPRTELVGPAPRDTLVAYAERLAQLNEDARPTEIVEASSTAMDPSSWFAITTYPLAVPLSRMSEDQIRDLVRFVVRLAEHMLAFVANPDVALGTPGAVYRRRGFPRSIRPYGFPWSPDSVLWCVTGDDDQTQETGVLEFCVNEFDAQECLSLMSRFPERFKDLKAVPWNS